SRSGHCPTERIDLLDEMPLTDAADGGIAAHLPECFDALREQQRAHADPSRGQGGLGPGMAAADDDDIEMIGKTHGSRSDKGRYSSGRTAVREIRCTRPSGLLGSCLLEQSQRQLFQASGGQRTPRAQLLDALRT